MTADEYRQLWRFTVDYLRDRGVHNLLYAYAPNTVPGPFGDWFFEFYPGDAYVDVLGLDDYGTLRASGPPNPDSTLTALLRDLTLAAEVRGKIPALTESGLEGMADPTWLPRLLGAIKADPAARRIAYVVLWRNANGADRPGHFFAPYGGHPSAASLAAWRADPLVRFGDELPGLYAFPRRP